MLANWKVYGTHFAVGIVLFFTCLNLSHAGGVSIAAPTATSIPRCFSPKVGDDVRSFDQLQQDFARSEFSPDTKSIFTGPFSGYCQQRKEKPLVHPNKILLSKFPDSSMVRRYRWLGTHPEYEDIYFELKPLDTKSPDDIEFQGFFNITNGYRNGLFSIDSSGTLAKLTLDEGDEVETNCHDNSLFWKAGLSIYFVVRLDATKKAAIVSSTPGGEGRRAIICILSKQK